MGKNQSASNLTNIIKQDANGNITFVSGSTTLMSVSSSGAIATTGNVAGTASYASNADLLDGLDSTVFTLTSSFTAQTASFTAFTASQNILNGTYATTGSNTFTGIQTVNSNLIVTGSITAQTLVVQTITSSVDFVTGSTRFGSLSSNTHTITGSMYVSGAFYITASAFQIVSPSTAYGGAINLINTSNNKQWNITNVGSSTGARSGNFEINNNSVDIFAISQSGNIGIGTTAPATTLHALGPIRSQDSRGGSLPAVEISGGNVSLYPYISVNQSNPMSFITSDTYRMIITGGGTILVGSTASTASMNQTGILQVAGGVRATSGLLTVYELGTISQNATITQDIPYNGLWLLTNGGNNSALIMVTRAGGSRGCQLVSSTNGSADIVVGTTAEPSGGTYLRVWMSAVGTMSIKNVNAYPGPYSMTPISTQ